jgi:hypothetical protein
VITSIVLFLPSDCNTNLSHIPTEKKGTVCVVYT